MKRRVRFVIGYAGYFLIAVIALKALILDKDNMTFLILLIGGVSLTSYIDFLESQYEKTAYSGLIRIIFMMLLLMVAVFFYVAAGE
ncbi:MAG TPA: hypothetical protein VK105_17235 [Virgibacillus sp.]|nr:hypothetical protein [Virgibacillus sp.]HLR68838.1 hypothetical protein [Virgibacillus sp.]